MAELRSSAVCRAIPLALAGAAVVGAALAGLGTVSADPADPGTTPAPVTIVPADPPPAPAPPPAAAPADPSGMTPHQASAPADAPVALPADAPVGHQNIPSVPNPTYGSGGSGGGIFGTLKDLWHQVQDPTLQDQMAGGGGGAAPPPGAGPAPALPPGYVSTNAPGSETASTGGGGPATGRPALPPGYYSISGPPPPGYQFGASPGGKPAQSAPAPVTPPVITAYPTP